MFRELRLGVTSVVQVGCSYDYGVCSPWRAYLAITSYPVYIPGICGTGSLDTPVYVPSIAIIGIVVADWEGVVFFDRAVGEP